MTHCRIGRVQMKAGGAQIRVMPASAPDLVHLSKRVGEIVSVHTRNSGPVIAGFAFMIWAADGASTCVMENMDGPIPSILIPDFVRNRLLAEKISAWAQDDTLNRLGIPT